MEGVLPAERSQSSSKFVNPDDRKTRPSQSEVMIMLMGDSEGGQFVHVLSEHLGPSFREKIADRLRTKNESPKGKKFLMCL